MSSLKDFYINEMGHNYDRIENTSWYISQLSNLSAIEIDNYLIGTKENFENLEELTKIFDKYKLKDTDTALTESYFPFIPLLKSITKNFQKKFELYSELALNINLLNLELKNIPSNTLVLEDLREFLCDFSRELSNERHSNIYKLAG